MNTEIITRLIRFLNESERESVYQTLYANGFCVDGFKDLKKAPVSKLIGSLNICNKKKKPQYIIMLEAIAQLNKQKARSDNLVEDFAITDKKLPGIIAQLCLMGEKENIDEINDLLYKYETQRSVTINMNDTAATNEVTAEKCNCELELANQKIEKLEETIRQLSDETSTMKAKNKENKNKIQQYKMKLEDSEKEVSQFNREIGRLQSECKKYLKTVEVVEMKCDDFQQEVVRLNGLILQKDLQIKNIQMDSMIQLDHLKKQEYKAEEGDGKEESVDVNECKISQTEIVLDNYKITDEKIINTDIKSDELLLNCMMYYSHKNDLYYDLKDLINFHTAVKCNSLVILSGMSGTGKSSLADIYAKSLGISENSNQYLFIPVRSSWHDETDLLGYLDMMNMVYRVSDTGFVDLLVQAAHPENKSKLFLVCFDEMNLASIEHYFSQFLSLCQKPTVQRKLRLYDEKYREQLKNAMDYPPELMIGDNVKFIGTIHTDEFSCALSDKILDRTNVISLQILNYADEWCKNECSITSKVIWTVEDYDAIIRKHTTNTKLRNFLWDMHMALQNATPTLGIGPRIVKSMEYYLNNLPDTGAIKMEKGIGIDYQVVQRILTKVRGAENHFLELLDDEGVLIKLFNKYADISDFSNSRQVVKRKREELENYGYCI